MAPIVDDGLPRTVDASAFARIFAAANLPGDADSMLQAAPLFSDVAPIWNSLAKRRKDVEDEEELDDEEEEDDADDEDDDDDEFDDDDEEFEEEFEDDELDEDDDFIYDDDDDE